MIVSPLLASERFGPQAHSSLFGISDSVAVTVSSG